MKRTYDWSGVDWTQPDATIAKQLGCTRMAAFKRRMKYNIAAPIKKRKPLPIPVKEWKRRARVVIEWLATPDHQSDAEEIERQTDAIVEEARKLTAND